MFGDFLMAKRAEVHVRAICMLRVSCKSLLFKKKKTYLHKHSSIAPVWILNEKKKKNRVKKPKYCYKINLKIIF